MNQTISLSVVDDLGNPLQGVKLSIQTESGTIIKELERSEKADKEDFEDILTKAAREEKEKCSTERGVRFSTDRRVAFAPLNTITAGAHNKGTLSQDGAFITVYGVEGAEKLDAVAKVFSLKPYSWIVDNDSDKLIQSLFALGGGRLLGDGRLSADFDSNGNGRGGYVLSVRAPSAKKI